MPWLMVVSLGALLVYTMRWVTAGALVALGAAA